MTPAPGAHASVPHEARVSLPGRPTRILVGPGVRHALPALLQETFPDARRIGFVADERVARLWPLEDELSGRACLVHLAPAGERAKDRPTLEATQDVLLDLSRQEPVVALGGGALLDLAGFAAATVRRGLPWVALPTTVVGMADAAVGGKVAINHPRGKNLLGTFHPPVLVLADPETLATLPRRDRVAGLAELYKTGRVGDPELLERMREGPPADDVSWSEILWRAVLVKARIVEEDERDLGRRRVLNYGHTVGHALETLLGNDAMRHGEGVAIGMCVAATIAVQRRLVPALYAEEQTRDLVRLGLPVALPVVAGPAPVLEALALDKKRAPGDRHTFVLPSASAGLVVAEDVEEAEIREALEACRATT